MHPPKSDAWPQPKRWHHCWARFGHGSQAPPAPGLILDWRREDRRWKAWVLWVDNTGVQPRICQGWFPVTVLRPANSDISVWNDGPWRKPPARQAGSNRAPASQERDVRRAVDMRAQTRGDAREARLEALQQQLSDAVAALVTGEEWKRALTFAARFRSRSFNNTMLIYAQHYAAHKEGRVPHPTTTYVAGFHQWLSLGRHVLKGQHGYGIFAPVTARFASPNPSDPTSWHRLARGEKPGFGEAGKAKLIGLKPTHVWDVSQTAGDPVPEPTRPGLLQGQAPAGLWDGLADQITAHGFELRLVSSAAAIGGANGLTDFLVREVSVRMDMDDAAQVKTLAHELGHIRLHAPR